MVLDHVQKFLRMSSFGGALFTGAWYPANCYPFPKTDPNSKLTNMRPWFLQSEQMYSFMTIDELETLTIQQSSER